MSAPLHVVSVPVPERSSEPGPLLTACVEVERAHHLEMFGYDDMSDHVVAVAANYCDQRSAAKTWLAACRGDDVVGSVKLTMSLRDNLSLGYFFANRRPGEIDAEVYGALWETGRALLLERGRTSVHAWAFHPTPGLGPGEAAGDEVGVEPEWLVPQTGAGRLAADDRARWLLSAGFVLEQVEVQSLLTVDPTVVERAARVGAALTAPGGPAAAYRLRTWVGATPVELRAGMARLRSRMSVDAPGGDLDYEEEVWDEEEVARRDERMEAIGRLSVTTVALDTTGEPVAYTDLTHPRDKPPVGYQDDTLVHGEHRGHRLGMAVKAVNLVAFTQAVPGVERIHTWNAEENRHMRAINDELGFLPLGTEGGWQWRAGSAIAGSAAAGSASEGPGQHPGGQDEAEEQQ